MASRSSVLLDLRNRYHQRILQGILNRAVRPHFSSIKGYLREPLKGRSEATRGASAPTGEVPQERFIEFTKQFVQESFLGIEHLRAGKWVFITPQRTNGTGDRYEAGDPRRLQQVLGKYPELRRALWMNFVITPDITMSRMPVSDSEINRRGILVNQSARVAKYAPLRKAVNSTSILHASISCNWTMRSDRAQNTRTEALNLIRGRKGNTPLIVAVTFEPLPSRIASLAMGTGDLDCTYHGALNELLEAVKESHNESEREILTTLVEGRRLRDISDLPFDLAT